MLEVLLQHKGTRDAFHEGAERAVPLYQLAHSAVVDMSRAQLDNQSPRGIDTGILAYECISGFVCPVPPEYDSESIINHVTSILKINARDEALTTLLNAKDRFMHEQPLASEVIFAVTSEYDRTLGEAAIMGAALAREIELSVADDTKHKSNKSAIEEMETQFK